MAIPTTIESLSITAASNGPAGSESRTLADDGLRQAYAFVRQLVNKGADIASAATITPPSNGNVFSITGTTTIATIASTNSWNGRQIMLLFAAALTLTHSSNLALPGSADITTAANDAALFVQTSSGAWRCVQYMRASGALVVPLVTAAADPLLKVTNTGNGRTAVAQAMGGIELTAAGMNTTNAYTPAVKFGSTDPQFTTTNPKFGALIVGEATETYAADTDGGMALLFLTTDNDPGAAPTPVERLRITHDGRLYGTALHNNAGAVTGTTNQYIASGSYTPSIIANLTNQDVAPTVYAAPWLRVGNVVTVSGVVQVDPTANGVTTTLDLNPPIATALTSFTLVSGAMVRSNGTNVGSVSGNAADNLISLSFVADSTALHSWHYHYTYLIE